MSKKIGIQKWVCTAAVVVILGLAAEFAMAQAAPAPQTANQPQAQPQEPAAPASQEPAAPAPQGPVPQAGATVEPFPPVNLKNFTADSPTREEVNSFLKAIWGFDDSRIWSVAAILKTPAPGVAKVVVFVSDKADPGKRSETVFFTTPDGKHAISGDVVDFGAKPFATSRQVLETRADGPAEGAASKDLELVEFADLQCAQCKDVQDTMANLARDFPQARIVFEDLPVTGHDPYSFEAAAIGECVRQAKGDAAFFKYAQTVFATNNQLTQTGAAAALSAAVTAAGADPKTVQACAATPAIKEKLEAVRTLANDLGINSIPTLVVNGHTLPFASMHYDMLKRVIAFQAAQDGIAVHVQPTLSTLQ